MLHDGDPYILEYNVRLGDPETEVIVVLNPEAFVNAVLEGYRGGRMEAIRPNGFAVDVVLASKGYPDNPEKERKSHFQKTVSSSLLELRRKTGNW